MVTIKHALIVNDSKSTRIMLQRLLEKMNLDTQAVESTEKTLRYLEDHHLDVIFIDHMMPGMSGFEATLTIKNNPKIKSIPTVMYTSKESNGFNLSYKKRGWQ
jgi:CheY-like chemotaxis protein